MTADAYSFWRAALALVGDCGKLTREQAASIGGIHESDPWPGFWRNPIKGMTPGGKKITTGFVPVAIWIDGNGQYDAATLDLDADKLVNTDPHAIWTYVVYHPITEETYHAVVNGEAWPKQISENTEA